MKLIDITPYFHNKSGGIKRYLLEKAKYLKDINIKHVLIVPGREKKSYYLEATKVYELPSFPLPLTGGYRYFSSFAQIREILHKESPDIVEVGGSYFLLPYLKSHKYLLTTFYHSDIRTALSLIPGPQKLKNILLESMIKKYLSKADLIFVPSRRQEEFLKSFGLKNIQTINLGVDTKTFNLSKRNPSFDKVLGLRENKCKLLYVGRLSIDKNIRLLFEVLQELDPSLFHLVIVGDGPLRKKVETLSKKLTNLTYLGYIHHKEELAQLYASCDLYVSASLRETYGLSFLEAQACGCVLIAFDLGLETQPFKEFLPREINKEALYHAIIKASRALSLSLKETISSYIINNFSWTSTFKKLMGVYERPFLTQF